MNATRPNYVPLRWIPTKDVAKLVRAYLKKTYPHTKFSVRSEGYSGGSSVRVAVPYVWTRKDERALYNTLSPWGSSGFDGMTDSSYGKGHALCPTHLVTLTSVDAHWGTEGYTGDMCCANAEPVHIGASYVTVSREWPRPDGITHAADARKGDVIRFEDGRTKTVQTVDHISHTLVTLFYADGMNDTFPQDELLARV